MCTRAQHEAHSIAVVTSAWARTAGPDDEARLALHILPQQVVGADAVDVDLQVGVRCRHARRRVSPTLPLKAICLHVTG